MLVEGSAGSGRGAQKGAAPILVQSFFEELKAKVGKQGTRIRILWGNPRELNALSTPRLTAFRTRAFCSRAHAASSLPGRTLTSTPGGFQIANWAHN